MLDTGQLPLNNEALLWYRQGLAAATADKFEQAIVCYDQVLAVRPDFYEAWYERGLALESGGNYAQAVASFDRAIQCCSVKGVVTKLWHDRGNALQYGLGEYTEAIAAYDQVLTLDSRYESAWQNRGNALLYGLSRPEDAIASYDRTLSINPQNFLAWRNRGNALVELRHFTEAIASYDQALEINPDDEVSWHARSLASERSGLIYKLPTTTQALSGSRFADSTFIEGETDARITYSSDLTSSREVVVIPQGQPLLILQDDWGRREILLERDRYEIGRDPKNDIQLHSKFVSRYHAVLTRLPESQTADDRTGFQISDGDLEGNRSTNGLLVNGRKYQTWELAPNDVVVFGPGAQATFQVVPVKSWSQ